MRMLYFILYIINVVPLHLHSTAPEPDVTITSSHNFPYFAGTVLNLTCTARLHANVDNGEKVIAEWSGPMDIPGERYTISFVSGPRVYIICLTISSLAIQDEGLYNCTGKITGDSSAKLATASDAISISKE